MVTSGRDIRAKRVREVTLPSGSVVEVRQPSLLNLISDERTPDMLRSYAIKAVQAGASGKKAPTLELNLQPENFGEVIKLMNTMARACLVNPRVVDNPIADDEISVDDLTDDDKGFLLDIAFGGEGRAAARFPVESPSEPVGVVPTG